MIPNENHPFQPVRPEMQQLYPNIGVDNFVSGEGVDSGELRRASGPPEEIQPTSADVEGVGSESPEERARGGAGSGASSGSNDNP